MFCSYCGKQIPDDAAFCAHCGKRLHAAEPQTAAAPVAKKANTFQTIPTVSGPKYGGQPQYGTPTQLNHAELIQKKNQIFAAGWKEFVASPLVLITLLVFSLSQLIAIVSNIEMISYIGDIGGVYTLVLIGSVAISALLVIGMWMVYADAVSNPLRNPSSAGLKIINVIMHINYIAYLVALVFVIIAAVNDDGSIRSLLRYGLGLDSQTARAVEDVLAIALMIAAGAIVAMYIVIAGILKNAINNVEAGDTDYSKLGGFGVFTIVMGGISALGILVEFTFTAVLSATSTILLGCVMLACKNALQSIEGQFYRLRHQSGATATPSYNPYKGY